MSTAEREAWERRWAEGGYTARPDGSPFLASWLDRIPAGRALDVAAGEGRNARLLAAAGFAVTAVDVAPSAVAMGRRAAEEAGLAIEWEVADLDDWDPGEACWDLVAVVRYRNPGLWPRLRRALAPGGWIVVEHHLRTTLPDATGPSDEAFRLAPGELLAAFADLRVVQYSEHVEPSDHPDHGGTFVTARFVAVDGDPGW